MKMFYCKGNCMIFEVFLIDLVGFWVNYIACYFLNEFKYEFYTVEIGIIIFNFVWCFVERIDFLDKTSFGSKKFEESLYKAIDVGVESLKVEGRAGWGGR